MQFKLGKVFGIPIDVDASWFIIFGLVVFTLALGHFPSTYPEFGPAADWFAGITAALFLFASVLIHELAHSVVAKKQGMPIAGITLFVFGGVSKMENEPETAWGEFKMAAAGPATSLLLGIGFWAVSLIGVSFGMNRLFFAIFSYLAVINVILAVFNMIPGFPLDGGRVLRSILWGATKNLELSTRMASFVGQGFGYLFILFGIWSVIGGSLIGGAWMALIGWFLANAARSGYEQMMLKNALSGVEVDRIMTPEVPSVSPDLTIEQLVDDYMMKQENSVFPVVQDDNFLGVVSLEDIQQIPRETWSQVHVRAITHPAENERLVQSGEDAWDAFRHTANSGIQRLLVLRDNKIAGMISRDNLLNLARARLQLNMNKA